VRANGYPDLLDMQAETIKLLVERVDIPDNAKHVLRIYSTYNAKAVTKFDTILEAVCADGRLHGMLLYHGAGTGRWSSLIVQLQNLFRPVIDDPETAVEAFKTRNLDWIRALYPQDPMKVIASTVRSHFIAGRGKKLIALDFAGVESRKNAWLWNEEWKLQAFRDYDAGKGQDQYILAVADALGSTRRRSARRTSRASGVRRSICSGASRVASARSSRWLTRTASI
jgi:DNA polymerase